MEELTKQVSKMNENVSKVLEEQASMKEEITSIKKELKDFREETNKKMDKMYWKLEDGIETIHVILNEDTVRLGKFPRASTK